MDDHRRTRANYGAVRPQRLGSPTEKPTVYRVQNHGPIPALQSGGYGGIASSYGTSTALGSAGPTVASSSPAK